MDKGDKVTQEEKTRSQKQSLSLASDKLLILEAEPPPDRLFIWV